MWMLRRASMHVRNQRLMSKHAQICSGKLGITKSFSENCNATLVRAQEKILYGLIPSARFFDTLCCPSKLYKKVHTFSSQAGAKRGGEEDDDIDGGFSELDEEGVADDIHGLDVFCNKTDVGENEYPKTRATSLMNKVILAASPSIVHTALAKWVEEGNEVTRTEVSLTICFLRKRRMFLKALQLLEWVKSTKHLEFIESDYVTHLDLIAKVRGIYKAEEYLNQIPESFRGERVYCTLLANCVSVTNVKKSEEIFKMMQNLGFPITCFSCSQVLLLYKRTDKKKIANVLQLMEEKNIKPSLFTYQILIDVKGRSKDMTGMEKIVETMKAEGCEPNTYIQALQARYYTASGLKDKAEAVMKGMEGSDITTNRGLCRVLLPLYASLGREDEVDRIWKVCEPNSSLEESMAAIEAWGQLNKIEKAEAAFEEMLKKVKRPLSRHFNVLLKVYANHKMLAKGKDLVKRMEESGCAVGPLTWDSLVKLYVGAGEVEKGDSILEKALKQKLGRPLFISYLTIMDRYAERGDVHNAEKIFTAMKQAGYAPGHRTYQFLLWAYENAEVPAYGFSDRMKADNISPNKALASQLDRIDAFKKSAVAELLE